MQPLKMAHCVAGSNQLAYVALFDFSVSFRKVDDFQLLSTAIS
jgi:hypothetical protein